MIKIDNRMIVALQAIVEIRGVNPYISVSASRARALKQGWRKTLPVLVRLKVEFDAEYIDSGQ